ncbi:hypothetical protein [Pontiella sulfatireligans]|uniref:Uncharacterized protein n=1 Tax=Pontiella sulfatireligans TaxID=2750658 RepID=A0A6C2UMZ8_9BACT|nr:hypothetical protein [Pontiella sulfatireligans]VGO21640.1 hypothetical protein SCARR_03714 [Pontiella sulfatireligans]
MVLYSYFMMGDSSTRKTFTKMIGDELVINHGEDYASQYSKEEFDQARTRLAWDEIPDTWFKEQMADADLSYNSLKRSCITTALLQIELAMEWLYKEKNLGPRKKIEWVPAGEIPAWFTDKALGEKTAGFFATPCSGG